MAKVLFVVGRKYRVRYSHIDIADNKMIQDYTAIRYKTLSRIVELGPTIQRRLHQPLMTKTELPAVSKKPICI